MKIGLVGAFDRNNFGDLLMPIVFEKQYNKLYPQNEIDFKYYGQLKRDMTQIKSYNTRSLIDCYNNCDIVIIVGGEVLSADYKLMYMNLQENRLKIFLLRCLNKVMPTFVDEIAKKGLKGIENKPWILDKDKLNCRKLMYNTIGGSINENKIDMRCLKKVDYISARSNYNYEEIRKINDKTKLYPDSVTAISELFTDSEILDNTGKDIVNMAKEDYFILQTDYRNNKDSFKNIAKQIDIICEKNNINCFLLPIGYAQGHDDQKALKKIRKYCKRKERIILPRMTNIYETLYILKNSKMFIGTSLHGIIVSTSYGIPHMVLTNKLSKLLNYVDTWETTSIKYTSIDNMSKNFEHLYNDDNEILNLNKYKKVLIDLAFENFNNINNIINEELEND